VVDRVFLEQPAVLVGMERSSDQRRLVDRFVRDEPALAIDGDATAHMLGLLLLSAAGVWIVLGVALTVFLLHR
jgi:hypothetical protein